MISGLMNSCRKDREHTATLIGAVKVLGIVPQFVVLHETRGHRKKILHAIQSGRATAGAERKIAANMIQTTRALHPGLRASRGVSSRGDDSARNFITRAAS